VDHIAPDRALEQIRSDPLASVRRILATAATAPISRAALPAGAPAATQLKM
jgi:hypothetical protein